jgi:hypothetical protein
MFANSVSYGGKTPEGFKLVSNTKPATTVKPEIFVDEDPVTGITYKSGTKEVVDKNKLAQQGYDVKSSNLQKPTVDKVQDQVDFTKNPITDAEKANALAYYEGRKTYSPYIEARNPRLSDIIMTLYPDFDFTTSQVRSDVRKQYSPNGGVGKQVEQFKFITNHLLDAEADVAKLGNGSIQIVNKVQNAIKQQTGDPDVDLVNALAPVVGGETAKAIIGSVTAQADRQELSSILQNFKSPAQYKAVFDGMFGLIGGRMEPLYGDWTRTMKDVQTPTAFPFEDKKISERLTKSGRDPMTFRAISKSPQSQVMQTTVFTPDKAKRLAELRAKKAAGTLK